MEKYESSTSSLFSYKGKEIEAQFQLGQSDVNIQREIWDANRTPSSVWLKSNMFTLCLSIWRVLQDVLRTPLAFPLTFLSFLGRWMWFDRNRPMCFGKTSIPQRQRFEVTRGQRWDGKKSWKNWHVGVQNCSHQLPTTIHRIDPSDSFLSLPLGSDQSENSSNLRSNLWNLLKFEIHFHHFHHFHPHFLICKICIGPFPQEKSRRGGGGRDLLRFIRPTLVPSCHHSAVRWPCGSSESTCWSWCGTRPPAEMTGRWQWNSGCQISEISIWKRE